jgi:hypothetical protein
LELFDRGRRSPGAREDRTRFVRGGRRTDARSFGNMTEKTDKKRDAPISYRPPADLADEFRRRVEASGLPVNAYITRAIFNAPIPRATRHPAAEKEMLAHLLARSAAIRDALDNATRIAGNDPRMIEAAEAAYAELKIIAAALMKMMERTP